MSFAPRILRPEPEPWFVAELKNIDPDLRVVFGFERYLVKKWVIERKIPPERYRAMYASLLQSSEPRFIDQPIFDDDQPIYDEEGEVMGYQIVGYRQYDLAPEYEWVMNVENEDGTFRPLDSRTILKLKRTYAWERFHSFSRLRFEKQREREEAEKKADAARTDELLQEIMDHRREIYNLPFSGQPKQVFETKES